MSTADEIAKLHQLMEKGALSTAEFEQAKSRLLEHKPPPGAGLVINRLRRSARDQWIAVLGLVFGGFTIFVYLVLWIFVPREDV